MKQDLPISSNQFLLIKQDLPISSNQYLLIKQDLPISSNQYLLMKQDLPISSNVILSWVITHKGGSLRLQNNKVQTSYHKVTLYNIPF